MKRRDFYGGANHREEEAHPVDMAIEKRLRHKQLRRKMRSLVQELMATRRGKKLWFELEELLSRYHAEREVAYFQLGSELGTAAGRMEGRAALVRNGSRAQRDLANWIRDIVIEADLPPQLRVATLLEVAWALALERASVSTGERTRRMGRRS